MAMPTSLRAYSDCQELYEAAARDPKGARACLGTYEAAIGMRTRMHYFRKLDREANAETYDSGHPMHGVSTFDEYVVQIQSDTAGEFWLYIRPLSAKILAIEGLSDVPLIDNDVIDVEASEVHMIEDQSK
jgi:hypothetical protein